MMRQRWLNFSLVLNTGSSLTQQASNKAGLLAGSSTLSSSAGMNAIFASYIQAGSTYRAIVLDAVIRLKDIADFFQKVPLLKGSTMRLYLNTNQCYFNAKLLNYQYTSTTGVLATAGSLTLTSTPVILGGGGTNPIMLASADLGQGLQPLVPLTSNAGAVVSEAITCGISIVRTQFPTSVFTQQISAPVSSVRLYAPAYTFSPIAEQRYLSLTPTKKVVYNDIFQYSFPSVGAGSPFNFLVSNGIPNVRGVLVVPLLPKASNGKDDGAGNYSGITTSTLYSPFCATGGAPDPVSFTNFNIQVSGKNLFINNLLYDFETFSQQFISSNQLNGSLTTGLTSGLVGFYEWENLFRYYYGNVSRSLPSEDGVAKAIQITGTNQSSKVVDIMVFVEFEREITIDVRTGARIQ
jgi:hypothetical protein